MQVKPIFYSHNEKKDDRERLRHLQVACGLFIMQIKK